MLTVLVTGADGQLGKCLKDLAPNNRELNFLFTNKQDLDITKKDDLIQFFSTYDIQWCINCAAYTSVDMAEQKPEQARNINVLGTEYLAEATNMFDVTLIHISSDFVFDGQRNTPYKENDKTFPINVYGKTKLEGENSIRQNNKKYYIIRTSWLYSEYNNNFLKTILNLADKKREISVVIDEIGSPTYAKDLASTLFKIIIAKIQHYGTFNYCNEGVVSRYELAKAIFQEKSIQTKLIPISSEEYLALAERPKYSALDTTKIKQTFNLAIPFWRDSLKKAILKL